MKKAYFASALVAALLVVSSLGLIASPAFSQPQQKPAPSKESFAELKQEFDGAMKKYQEEREKRILDITKELLEETKAAEAAVRLATTDEAKAAAHKQLQAVTKMADKKIYRPGPEVKFALRFLEFAERYPQDSSAFESIVLALQLERAPTGYVLDHAIKNLDTYHVANPGINKVFLFLENALFDGAIEKLVRDIIVQNPSRRIRALACRKLAYRLEQIVRLNESLKVDPATRSWAESMPGGKDRVAWMIANSDRHKKDAEALTLLLRERYGDVFPDLSIGKVAPEVLSQDIDGKSVKLSTLKGKVVVLDVWGTWCGPCRAMIPHERAMVGRLKDKPFVLVSISLDEEKKSLTDFLAKEKTPWTHWWDGQEGGLLDNWNITRVPTIYVLDAQGVIRYKDIRGEELEAAVNVLLKEVERRRSSNVN